jgi:DNA-binding response OmpR family regulator
MGSMTQTKAKILLIEGKRAEHPIFFANLTAKGFQVDLVSNGSDALTHLAKELPHLVLINAPSMRTSGRRICQTLRTNFKNTPLVLVSENDAKNVETMEADIVLIQPFTLQKLLNRIRLLLPAEDKDLFHVGPLYLDIEHRWARCLERQVRLTPRLVSLLKALMEHPGEVFEREELFRLVWETAYTGDTRTLDVHISWLREAVEEDPRHPQLIKTVRGIGYRLDVDVYPNLPTLTKNNKKNKIK